MARPFFIMKRYPLIFIVGPTAVGKSDVALELAKLIDAEIISCDSMMVYKEASILTNKPDNAMCADVPHHMLDLVSVTEDYDVVRFTNEVYRLVDEIYPQKNIILCGGTGMYSRVILDGIFDDGIEDKSVKTALELEYEKKGLNPLLERLKQKDPDAYTSIDKSNSRRVIRALEVVEATGVPLSVKQKESRGLADKFDTRMFVINKNRQDLYDKINLRTKVMFNSGVLDEVRSFFMKDLSATASKMLGLQQIVAYLKKQLSLDETIDFVAQKTRNYAKRQLTWFRKESRAEWIDRDGLDHLQVAKKILEKIQI